MAGRGQHAAGVRNVPERLYDVAAMLRLSRTATIRKIVIPAVVPSWLAGARLATIIALHVTITAEMVMAPAGLGGALVQAMQALNVERMWAYAVVCGIVGASANAGLRRLVAAALPGARSTGRWAPGRIRSVACCRWQACSSSGRSPGTSSR